MKKYIQTNTNNLSKDYLKPNNSNKILKNDLGGALNNMKFFAVDRKEGKYTVLQNLETQKMHEVKSSKLPPFLNDGDVVKKIGFNKYEFDLLKTNSLKTDIEKSLKELITE